MSPADLESIIREKQQLRDSINATSDRLEHLKTSKWDLDVQIGKLTLKVRVRFIDLVHFIVEATELKRVCLLVFTFFNLVSGTSVKRSQK